jgi:molybdate transport system substrate-binding protein
VRTFLSILFILSLLTNTGCVKASDSNTITVFAGAGMSEPLLELADLFKKETGIIVLTDLQGSGRLTAKIVNGQKCGLFIPASGSWKAMIQPHVEIHDEFVLANHVIVLAVRNEVNASSLNDIIINKIPIALGDAEGTAIGKTTEKLFKSNNISIDVLNLKSYALTVKQLVSWIENGSVASGIVWKADVYNKESIRIVEIENSEKHTEIIPVYLLEKDNENVLAYYNFLKKNGKQVFLKYGFEGEL